VRDYCTTVLKRARSDTLRFLREQIVVEALIAIAAVVLATAVARFWQHQPVPQILASGILALASLGLVVLLVFTWNLMWAPVNLARENEQERVKLREKITDLQEAQRRKALIEALTIENEHRWWRPQPGGPTLGAYLGFKCSNQTDDDILNCRIRLESLQCWEEESRIWISPHWFSALLLAWSFNDGGGDTKTIGARSNRTCDVVCYESKSDTHATIVAAQEGLRQGNQVGFGTWRVRCNVEAEGYLPVELEAAFVWEPYNTPAGQLRKLEFIELSDRQAERSPNGEPSGVYP
jgi:hypothetical protein